MDAFLEEHHWLVLCRLHHPFLLQRMFLHALATRQKKHNCTIHWCRQEPSPEQYVEAEPSTIELVGPEPIGEEIAEIYWDVYQLRRSPGKLPCDGEMEKHLCQEILDSIKECLWHKWVPHCQGRNQAGTPPVPLSTTPRLNIVPRTTLPMTD